MPRTRVRRCGCGRLRFLLSIAWLFLALAGPAGAASPRRPPNVVLILCDNLGYGDIGCFGSTVHRTPHVDQLAADGLRLTSFYSASGVCTPSRAALMTGCYPRRVGLHVTDPDGAVLRPVSPNGLHPDEVTIAEMLRSEGYATICIGKWHLGDQPALLPMRQGFDSWLGIPYSDDMTPRPGRDWPPLPLMEDDRVVEAPADRNLLTQRYTHAATAFIRDHRDEPFFLYLAHAMPGSTRHPFASDDFRGRSANGPWGDSVEEIDWSTGEILEALRDCGLQENTLVIWTSDNGAPRRNPPQGSNGPLAGWGYSVQEGGMRVPCVVRWPGVIPAGSTSDVLTTMMDWWPTLAAFAGGPADPGRPIDGRDLGNVLRQPDRAESPHEVFGYYHRDRLEAVRSGPWKLYLARNNHGELATDPTNAPVAARLYDVAADPGERHDVAADHPDVVAALMQSAVRLAEELGDGPRAGSGQRPVGRVSSPTPRLRER